MRVLIAGLVGGIAMFIWSTIAHVATPLASAGLQPLPNEAATVATLHTALGDRPGLYFFPFLDGPVGDSKAMADQSAKMQLGPTGMLAYQPPGSPALMPRRLAVEFLLEVVDSLLAAAVVAAAAGVWRRLAVAVAVGVIAGVATNLSYWNWYAFSWDYTVANAFTELMKFVFAGAAIVGVLAWRRRSPRIAG